MRLNIYLVPVRVVSTQLLAAASSTSSRVTCMQAGWLPIWAYRDNKQLAWHVLPFTMLISAVGLGAGPDLIMADSAEVKKGPPITIPPDAPRYI